MSGQHVSELAATLSIAAKRLERASRVLEGQHRRLDGYAAELGALRALRDFVEERAAEARALASR